MSGSVQPAPGKWRYQILARPRLTMLEVPGKTGIVVWGRWFDASAGKKGAPKTKSTGISIRFPDGHKRAGQINPAREQEVMRLASVWHADLLAGRAPGTGPEAGDAPRKGAAAQDALTIADGFRIYLDLRSGAYPKAGDQHRRDVLRAAKDIEAALGATTIWADVIPLTAAQTIWRHVHRRFATGSGVPPEPATKPRSGSSKTNRRRKNRGGGRHGDGATWAKRTVQTFFACAAWLRDRNHIPAHSCLRPERWQEEFKRDWRKLTGRDLDEERDGLRHTPEEGGKLLKALYDERVDPRLRLNILFGGDSLRAGQVRRAMRSDLDLSPVGQWGLGRLRVRGRAKKRGSVVDLDPVMRESIDYELSVGYLRDCEAAYQAGQIADYALMPQGRFVEGRTPVRANRRYLKPISKRTLLDYFHDLEEIAGVDHIPGRGWYGLRRLWSDLSPEHTTTTRAREVMGGWARGSKVPDQVYRSKDDEAAIREAARGRAAIREELRNGTLSEVSALRVTAIQAISNLADVDALRAVLQQLGMPDPTADGTEKGDDERPSP